jgi:transposase
VGYRGKVKEQEQVRGLRAQNRTLADIAQMLGVSKSSVSLWVRDVPFTPTLRLRGPHRRPHPAHEAKVRQIEQLNREGLLRIGVLSDEAFFVVGVALYSGEVRRPTGKFGSRTATRKW